MSGLADLVSRFSDRRVLVLGDMVADEYLVGRPERISREAPVLILQLANSFIRPGGATNPAHNIAALGGRTSLVGVIGDDEMGQRLCAVLEDAGIGTEGLVVDTSRPTSTATRVVASGSQQAQQQIVRLDRIDRHDVDGRVRDRMIDMMCRLLPEHDALLISDYENGVISGEVVEECLPRARAGNLTVTVDSHGDLFRFRGVTAATPNEPEAAGTVHFDISEGEALERAGRQLLEGMEAQGVLITRGSAGLSLFERGKETYHVPISIEPGAVVDVTGAGDTVAAVFTLAVASGGRMRDAAFLANVAGGQVVKKLGAATIRPDELLGAVRQTRLSPPA